MGVRKISGCTWVVDGHLPGGLYIHMGGLYIHMGGPTMLRALWRFATAIPGSYRMMWKHRNTN
jgi:hypothetical protein